MSLELLLTQPINQLASLCLTVAYYPPYTEDFYAHEIENIVVPQFELNKFIQQAQYVFGMEEFISEEEFEEDTPIVYTLLTKWKPGLCPYIVSAFYLDEMGRVKLVASGIPLEEAVQWEVSKGW